MNQALEQNQCKINILALPQLEMRVLSGGNVYICSDLQY